MSNIVRSLIVRTGVDMSGMTVGLKKLSTDLKRAGRQITKTGQSLTKNISVPLLAVGAASIKFASEFGDGMAKVNTIADTAVKSISELSDEVMAVSDNTGKAADELTESLYQAISAGADTADAMDLVETASKAAIGGFTDTTTAVDGLTSVINAYGLKTTDADKIANKFLITQNLGKTTFGQLAGSIGGVISVSATAGVSIDSLLSSLATLTMNGISTDEAVTGVKSALSNIIKPSEQAATVAEQLGLDFSAAALQSKGFAGFLADVKEKTGGNIETIAQLFGNVRGLNAVLKLTSDEGLSKMNNIMGEMETNTTALDDAYETMAGTVNNQFKIALNSLKNYGIELGQKLMPIINNGIIPAIKSLGEFIGKLIDNFSNLSPFMQDMVTLALAITVAIGPLTTVVGKLLITIGSLTKSFNLASAALAGGKGLMTAITTFLGPAGTVVIAIAAIAAVVGTLVIAFNNANAEMKALKKETQDFNDVANQSKGAFKDLIETNEASAGAAKILADELYNLADKENKSTAEKTRMKDIVNQLNGMYKGLNLTIDETTGLLSLEKKAIEDVIDAKLEQFKLNAYSERLTELYEEQYRAAENLRNITSQMSDSQIALAEKMKNSADYQKLYNEALSDGTITTNELKHASTYLVGILDTSVSAYIQASMVQDQNTESINNATKAYEFQAEKVVTTSDTVQDATEQTGIAWSDLSDTQKAALKEMGTTQEDYTAMSEEDLQGYIDTTREQQEEMKDLLDERIAVTQNAFEKIESTIDVSLDKMIENLESNQELVSTWTDNLAILTDKGLNEGFIQVLEDTGVDAAATVAGLVDASDEEIQRLNDVFMNGSTVAIDSMRKELGLPTTVNVGSKTISNIADGVENNKEFTDAATKQVKDTKAAMATQVSRSNFTTIGKSMIQGTINGMNSLGGNLRSTARSLAKSAYNSMKSALDMHSPSKKTMEIGRFFVGGLINGMDEMSQNAVITAKALSSNIVNALAFDTIQTPSMSDFDTINSPQMSGLSPMSTVMQNTTNNSKSEIKVPIEITGPIYLSNEMDVEKTATLFGYYLQEKLAAQGA
jgi:TP901 family phage tail tape measure protein